MQPLPRLGSGSQTRGEAGGPTPRTPPRPAYLAKGRPPAGSRTEEVPEEATRKGPSPDRKELGPQRPASGARLIRKAEEPRVT